MMLSQTLATRLTSVLLLATAVLLQVPVSHGELTTDDGTPFCCIGPDGCTPTEGTQCYTMREFIGFHYCTNQQGKVDCGSEADEIGCSDLCCNSINDCLFPTELNCLSMGWYAPFVFPPSGSSIDQLEEVCINSYEGRLCGDRDADDWGYCPAEEGKDFKSCCRSGNDYETPCDETKHQCFTLRDFAWWYLDLPADCGFEDIPGLGCSDWVCFNDPEPEPGPDPEPYPPGYLFGRDKCTNPENYPDSCYHLKDEYARAYDPPFNDLQWLCENLEFLGGYGKHTVCENKVTAWYDPDERDDYGYCTEDPPPTDKFKTCCLGGAEDPCDPKQNTCYTMRDFTRFWYDSLATDCGNPADFVGSDIEVTECSDYICENTATPKDPEWLPGELKCQTGPQKYPDTCYHVNDLPTRQGASPPYDDPEYVCRNYPEASASDVVGTVCENTVPPLFDVENNRDEYGYCPGKGFTGGDPHIQTWNQQWYDFMGECSLVFLRALDFAQGLGLEIHIRTKVRFDYSYIESAVIKIGDDVMEVLSYGTYIVNGVQNAALSQVLLGGLYHVNYEQPSDKESKFVVELSKTEHVVFHVFKDLVSVKVEGATYESFGTSQGLMGEFGTGRRLARNGTEVSKDDVNGFASNWQVLETEYMLFQTALGPQHPHACKMPDPTLMKDHRRLLGATVTEEEARVACNHWEHVEPCVYDVMKTGDLELANSDHY